MVDSANSITRKILGAWSLAVLLLIYIPVALLVIYGFNGGSYALRWEGFSLRWYEATLTNREMLGALFNSLMVALLSTSVAVTLAFLYALWAHRTQQKRLAGASDSLLSLPLFIPEIVIAIGLLVMMARFIKPKALELGFHLDSLGSVVLGHTTLALGYAALVLRTRFNSYDLQQELAAKDLGANRWNVLWYIMLPQVLPGLAAAACISFAVSLDDFYVSYFLSTGGSALQTLPLYIWSLQGRRAMTPEINVVSSLLLLIALLFFGLGLTLSRSRKPDTLNLKG